MVCCNEFGNKENDLISDFLSTLTGVPALKSRVLCFRHRVDFSSQEIQNSGCRETNIKLST